MVYRVIECPGVIFNFSKKHHCCFAVDIERKTEAALARIVELEGIVNHFCLGVINFNLV